MKTDLLALVGRTINRATKIGEDIFLSMSDGTYIRLIAYADCCAQCFFQHVSNASALHGATIRSITDMSFDENMSYGDTDDGNCVQVFGHVFETDKGTCQIELRNEHNGYYEGSLMVEPWNDEALRTCYYQNRNAYDLITNGPELDDF